MFEKSLAAAALAVLAVFAVPAAANAVGHVPQANIAVSGAVVPDSSVVVAFTAGSFVPGEDVSFTLAGEDRADLALLKSVVTSQSLVKTAANDGSVALDVTVPATATGTFTATATGLASGTVGTASLTVGAADSGAATDGDLAATGYTTPMLAIWGGSGALLLGVALIVVLGVVRRQRAHA